MVPIGTVRTRVVFYYFVLPEYQDRDIDKLIINTLVEEEFYKRASRIEMPASITAVLFYQKFGYKFKNGVSFADEEGLVRMEKKQSLKFNITN
ncbi:GNAT family N-acetyltransferase [Staphylococcus epidermidis]|uniref:GNAT family N-acetyltransferase n=1 Tax=Staphylococcus epidermidis TaxID=1282 RepID=UPI001E4DA042|nr:GNAT family N-acetyltransferase [Staphylococcus epidermidis]